MPDTDPIPDPVYIAALLLADHRRTTQDMAGSRQPTDAEWALAHRIVTGVTPPLGDLIGEQYSRATRKAVAGELWDRAGDPPEPGTDAFKRFRTLRHAATMTAPDPTPEEMATALAEVLSGLAARTARSPKEDHHA